MRTLRKWRLRLDSLFARSRADFDLEDELRDFVDREVEREIAAGTPPIEARRRAMRSLEGMERLKDECRDARGVRWLQDSLSDVRFAFRTLRKAPVFTVAVIAALAFCIGANTAIFSIVDAVLFRPLPFPNQDRLVSVSEGLPAVGVPVTAFGVYDYLFVAANNRSFESTGAYFNESYEVSGAGMPRRAMGARVSASLFQVLGIPPVAGRAFTRDEDEQAKRVLVLSYRFAQSVFGGPERALGRTIFVDRTPYSVVGVMPWLFSFPIQGAQFNANPSDLFVPASWSNADRLQKADSYNYSVVARLKPGITVPQASAEMLGLLRRVVQDFPPDLQRMVERIPNFSLTSRVIPFREEFASDVKRPLLLLMAAVCIVLLVGCADVANLMFSRMVGRQQEFALRAALGAGRWRLARQILIEGLLLSLAGGGAGLCLAWALLPLLRHFASGDLPLMNEVGLNWRMMAFAAAVTLAAPFVFCLAPFANTVRDALVSRLRSEGRTSTQNKRHRLAMSSGVIMQFSLALVLLSTAGLLTRSLMKATEANPGFRPDHVIGAQVALPDTVYKTPEQIASFFDRLSVRLAALPGVRQAGAMSNLPMDSTSNRLMAIQGRGNATEKVEVIFCRGDALDLVRVVLLKGRLLRPADQIGKQHSVVISEGLAKRISPDGNVIGRGVKWGVAANPDPWMTVVGVVGDVKDKLTSTAPRNLVFTTTEDWVNSMNVLIRAYGDPKVMANAIRREVTRLDPSLPAGKFETMNEVLDESLSAERFRTWLLVSFAAAAMLLAALGIGGLLAYNAAQRTREFGVRIAVGADRRDLLFLVLKHCLRLSGLGIAVGLVLSVIATRALSALLYGTSPLDPATFLGAPLILMLVALAAAVIPAWRALRTDPIAALRMQ